jgi:hypothetical protein
MDGDHQTDTPETGWQYRPVDNPPSLAEPSRPTNYLSSDQLRQELVARAQPSVIPVPAPAPTVAQVSPTSSLAQSQQPEVAVADNEDSMEWTASGDALLMQAASWRARMSIASLIVGVLVYIITRDLFSTAAVTLIGVTFGMLGGRKPSALHYVIDRRGITIGNRKYHYNEFRAFVVNHEKVGVSLSLVPLKRFLPMLSVPCDPAHIDKIVAVLADHLPMETPSRDAFDRIINRANF